MPGSTLITSGLRLHRQSPVNSIRGRLYSAYTSSPVEDYQNLIDSDEETENPAVKKSADSAFYTLCLETDLSPTSRHLYEKTAPQSTESNLDRRDQLTWDDEVKLASKICIFVNFRFKIFAIVLCFNLNV